MCGIAGGSWTENGPPLELDVLRRMTDVLSHRGPDDSGFYDSRRVASAGRSTSRSATASHHGEHAGGGSHAALGHRRLSIIDLDGGHQPLANEDGSVWIAFNGEIYNYRELRPELERQGHVFQTATDTEVIVHLYEQHGVECLRFLRGMFAFAVWDHRTRTLFLARDRLGKKPLLYCEEQGRLLFASELKALLQVPGAPRELNPRALDSYLTYQYVPHPETILHGYCKLPPGHYATYRDGRLDVQRYWQPPYEEDSPNSRGNGESAVDEARWRSELRATLTEAVRLRLRSDVPLGAFLSGGVDSTIVAGLMQQLSERPIHTFSIGFNVAKFDERSYAREAAQKLGTNHHEFVVEPKAVESLPRLIWFYDEPFADSSAIPTMHLAEMTRREVTVALSGDGADELFAGYDRYRAVQLGAEVDRLPMPLRRFLTAPFWQKLPASVEQKSRRRRLKRFLAALGQEPARRYLQWIGIFDEERRRALYTPGFRESLGGFDSTEFLLSGYAFCRERDIVTRTSCADVMTYLPGDILKKVDTASMASSLECRCPFLDHHVAELAARMPVALKRQGKRGKKILVETFSDLLPESIQERRKMGFGVPIDHWFRGELKSMLQDVLLDSSTLGRGYFEPQSVQTLVSEHVSGQWDHSYRLWSLLCFELWHRMFLDSAAASIPPSPVL